MKRAPSFALAAILTLTLAACTIVVGEPEPVFSASNLSVDSNYVEDETGPYICDEATTNVSYTFDFEGQIRRWSQALREYNPEGEDTERATYEEVIRPENRDATVSGGSVTYEFAIDPRTALEPVPVDSQISPQQINVVVDTRLVVEATGTDGQSVELSAELPTKCLEQ